MKTIFTTLTLAVFASFLFMGGCVKKLTAVDIEFTTDGSLMTDSLKTTGYQTIDTIVMTSQLEAEMKKNGSSLSDIDEVKLKSATVKFTAPMPTDNFDKVDMVELWLTAPTLPSIKLAFKNPVAKSLNSVSLDVDNTSDLAQYLKSPSFGFEVKGTNNQPLGKMDLTVIAKWNVKASKE